jgi:hypothetical protein
MKKQITNVTPRQAAKVFALLYFFSSLPFVMLMAVPMLFIKNQENGFPAIMLIAMPFLYLIFGYVFTIYGAWIYNKIATRIGGVEFEVTEI